MSDPWKSELDAIVGARHGGRTDHVTDLLLKLATRFPNVAEIHYQLAWTLDTGGKPADALPHYEKAIALGLLPNQHANALIGLAITLRTLALPTRAVEVLRSGQLQFPENREFDVFLSLVLHDLGEHAESLRLALLALCDTTGDTGLTTYQRTLRYAAHTL